MDLSVAARAAGMSPELALRVPSVCHGAMMSFSIGDRVGFAADGRRVEGILTRYNKRTVTVIADGGARWNVSPGLLVRVERGGGVEPAKKTASVVVVRPEGQAGRLLGKAGT